MPIVPITLQAFSDKRFKHDGTYRFANRDKVVPVLMPEVPRMLMQAPLGFVAHQGDFLPVAVLGVGSERNLYVDAAGHWLADYVPAVYRTYPFSLARSSQGLVLCIDDETTGLGFDVGDALFDEDGKPSEFVKGVLDFLNQIELNRQQIRRVCKGLNDHQLLVPWSIPVKIEGSETMLPLPGLFRVDEKLLRQLDQEALHRLHLQGALSLAYAHLYSMQHIPTLLKRAQERLSPQNQPEFSLDVGEIELGIDDLSLGGSGP